MKKLCIAFHAFLFALPVMALAGDAAKSSPASDGWNATRLARQSAFPADAVGTVAESTESAELFPADANHAVAGPTEKTQQPSRAAQPIYRIQALHVFPNNRSGRPRLLSLSQPAAVPPAPGVGEKAPPIPKDPADMPPQETPMEQTTPEMTDVDEVFEGEAYAEESGDFDHYYDWCKHFLWRRSSGDMPQHMPYQPVNHGYYYHRPYNYNHVFEHQQRAPMLGADSIAPYETGMFEKVYKEVLGDEATRKAPIPTVRTPDSEALPTLESLLDPSTEE